VSRNVPATAIRRIAWCLALALVALVAAPAPALASDPKTEKAAQALQKKAIEEDNLNLNYAGAIKKLQSAIGKCGASKCSPTIKGTLLRDLGAMQVLSGAADAGKASFSQALALDATLELDPAYKNPTLDAAWNDAKAHPSAAAGGNGAAAPEVVAGPQPTGDFTHTPPPEALVRTPLPIFVEYPGSEDIAKVIARYKGAGASDWKAIELPKLDTGYGAVIPCKDVPQGLMQYYVQGLNDKDDPVATSGSRNKPFSVVVKAQIDTDPPALPGQDPPTQCADVAGPGTECPPDFPGCAGGARKAGGEDCEKNDECKSDSCVEGKCEDKKAGGEECEKDSDCNSGTCSGGKCSGKKADGEDCSSDDECDSGRCKQEKCSSGGSKGTRVWVGLGVQLDVYSLPTATDVCKLNGAGNGPQNSAGYGCLNSSNAPFPGTKDPTLNASIAPTSEHAGDQVGGGFKLGNVRLLASLDFAAGQNVLIGVRAGYILNTDPSSAAPKAAFAPVHAEGRLTYVLGKNALSKPGISPMLFIGAGVGEFDAYVPVKVYNANPPPGGSVGPFNENAWLTAGPLFLSGGGGVRYLMGPKMALNLALRLEAGLGGSAGFLPGIAPELGVQFGL
jgi:hypothetical protein